VSWVHETLADFGRQMGLPDLDFGTHGVAQLEMESGNLIAVEPVQRGDAAEVLVYIGRPLGYDGAPLLRRALARAHHAEAGAMPVQVAVRGEAPDAVLLVLVRVPERDFTLQSLGQAVDYLGRWYEGLRER
jgi:type III secretion system chaperone SycN